MATDEFTFDLSAAQWRKSIADERAFVEALAVRLEQALPGMVTVTRHFAFFSKDKRVESVVVRLGDAEYELLQEKNHAGIRTRKGKVVRGVRLKSDELPFTEWLRELSAEIQRYSEEHQDTRETLERFLLGD
ncbi:hypothetical protein [Alicyclobacillus ferrooxydans]|uniref:hypothetical protein n=1 Tax=Alicyclobacillus ferrooxydans TaxID=471514 RepID=UPI0006D54286|nr:hypothetical protein [Alicyclobacillus ferrooxydans]